MFGFTRLGRSLYPHWMNQTCAVFTRSRDNAVQPASLTPLEGGFPSGNTALTCSLPTLTLPFKQPLQDTGMPLIHAEKASCVKEDTHYT